MGRKPPALTADLLQPHSLQREDRFPHPGATTLKYNQSNPERGHRASTKAMSHKRKRDSQPPYDSSSTEEPHLKRSKTSALKPQANADALALIMAVADFSTATRISIVCTAGQQVWNDSSSLFWYSHAKMILPGLADRQAAVDYKKTVSEVGLPAVAKTIMWSRSFASALILPENSDLNPSIQQLKKFESGLGDLVSIVGAVTSTWLSQRRIQKETPLLLDEDDEEPEEGADAITDKGAAMYGLIAAKTGPFLEQDDADKYQTYTFTNEIVYGTWVVLSASGCRKCYFQLAINFLHDTYAGSFDEDSSFLLFYRLDGDNKFTRLDDSLCGNADIIQLFEASEFQPPWSYNEARFDRTTAAKILNALELRYDNTDGETIFAAWKVFYRRLIAFASASERRAKPAGTSPDFEPRPWRFLHCRSDMESTDSNAVGAPMSRQEYFEAFDNSLSALLSVSPSQSLDSALIVAQLAYRYAICVHRLVATLKLVSMALEGHDVSTIAAEDAMITSDENSADSPYQILDVATEATAKEIIANASLPFTTGCAFYELLKSESVSKTKQIVAYHMDSKKWFENDDARNAIGAKIGADCKIGRIAGYRVFVQSTSPNRKIPAGSGLLYKGEIVAAKATAAVEKVNKRKRTGDDSDGGDDDENDDEDGKGGEEGENETSSQRRERYRNMLAPKLLDVKGRGKLSLLSFFACATDFRNRIVTLSNRMWITAIEEGLSYVELAYGIIDPEEVSPNLRFAAILRASQPHPHAEGTSSKFGFGFFIECRDDRDGAPISANALWNTQVDAQGKAFVVSVPPSGDPNLADLGCAPTEISFLATPLLGYFDRAETTPAGKRLLHCSGNPYAVKISVAREVLATRLLKVLSSDVLAQVRTVHLFSHQPMAQ